MASEPLFQKYQLLPSPPEKETHRGAQVNGTTKRAREPSEAASWQDEPQENQGEPRTTQAYPMGLNKSLSCFVDLGDIDTASVEQQIVRVLLGQAFLGERIRLITFVDFLASPKLVQLDVPCGSSALNYPIGAASAGSLLSALLPALEQEQEAYLHAIESELSRDQAQVFLDEAGAILQRTVRTCPWIIRPHTLA